MIGVPEIGERRSYRRQAIEKSCFSLWMKGIPQLNIRFLTHCVIASGLLCAGMLPQTVSAQERWRLGYVNADSLPASSFPFSYYTHVSLLGLNCNGNGALYNQWGYETNLWPAYRAGASAAGVKLMLFLGGNMTSCTNSSNLANYVKKIVGTVNGTDTSLNTGGVVFDGVTLDWESGMSNSVTTQYENLISALRAALGSNKLISVDGWQASYFATVIVNQQNNIDRFDNEMYDSAVNGSSNSAGQEWSWYNLADKSLNSNDSGSAESGFQYYVAAGFPASKINEGIPFYGYLYSGCTHAEVVGCKASGTQYTYRDIRNKASWWNTPHLYDSNNQSDYISFAGSNQYLTYTDTDQISALTTWGDSVNIGGYFVWEVDFEALSGGTQAQNFPLSFALYTDSQSGNSYAAPSITSTSPLPAGTVGKSYSLAVSAAGTKPMTWSITTGKLPSGLSLDSSSGVISGAPATSTSASFTVEASNAAGTSSKQFALAIGSRATAASKFKLVSKNSGLCLDVTGMSTAQGVQLQQWACTGNTNQTFQFAPVQGGYEIIAENSGLLLAVDGGVSATENGAAIVQSPKSGEANQIWNLTTSSDGSYSLKSVSSGKCVDVLGESTSEGAKIQQWQCTGNANQKWTLTPVQ